MTRLRMKSKGESETKATKPYTLFNEESSAQYALCSHAIDKIQLGSN